MSLPKLPRSKLQEACAELLLWAKDGILLDNGVVREYVEELQKDSIPKYHDALRVAVEEIKTMALSEVVNNTVTKEIAKTMTEEGVNQGFTLRAGYGLLPRADLKEKIMDDIIAKYFGDYHTNDTTTKENK